LKPGQIGNQQGHVSFPCRPEVRLHAQVNFETLTLKPTAAALRQMGRLGHFFDSQRAPVESAGEIFAAGRHGQLHVIDTRNSQLSLRPQLDRSGAASAA
jgi:hypothetical protein